MLPSYIVFNHIKRHTNVSIGGDGGDENFFGYITFDAFYLSLFLKKIIPNFIFKLISRLSNLLPNSTNYISINYKIKKFFSQIIIDKKYLNTMWLSSMAQDELEEYFNEKINYDEVLSDVKALFSSKLPIMRLCQLYYFKFYLPILNLYQQNLFLLNIYIKFLSRFITFGNYN